MNTSLAAFQEGFIRALYGVPATDSNAVAVAAQPGFAVYRNTVIKGCIDALQANFPTVEQLVGVEWFRSAAAIYARTTPPEDARLLLYGATFPAFLDTFEPARELTYLAGVAHLDRMWIESHIAPDEIALTAAEVTRLSPARFMQTVLRPHASARWTWFDARPVYTIWRTNREALALPAELDWRAEGVLLLRTRGRVIWRPLSEGGCALLDACAEGRTLDEAFERALAIESDLDLAGLMATLFADGAFSVAIPRPDNGHHD